MIEIKRLIWVSLVPLVDPGRRLDHRRLRIGRNGRTSRAGTRGEVLMKMKRTESHLRRAVGRSNWGDQPYSSQVSRRHHRRASNFQVDECDLGEASSDISGSGIQRATRHGAKWAMGIFRDARKPLGCGLSPRSQSLDHAWRDSDRRRAARRDRSEIEPMTDDGRDETILRVFDQLSVVFHTYCRVIVQACAA